MKRAFPVNRLPAGALYDPIGLSEGEAQKRSAQYGLNLFGETKRNRYIELAGETARDPMIWFLLIVSALYWSIHQRMESTTLLVAILPLIAMDAYLHRRTQASTEALKSRLSTTSNVIRDGRSRQISVDQLVPGDIVEIQRGEYLPADGLVVAGEELMADESALTGEAFPVRKHSIQNLDESRPDQLTDVSHWGFAGTRLLAGKMSMRIGYTGGETLYGQIVESILSGTQERTPLQRTVSRFVYLLLSGAAVLCILLALARLLQGYGWIDAIVSAATLAVAAIPEEFPIVVSVFLGVGVYRLARRKALVRKAASVENIGRVTCICSDKTGTMTEGTMTLAHSYPAVSDENLMFTAFHASQGGTGDPIDTAILQNTKDLSPLSKFEILKSFPFTESRRRETAIVRNASGECIAAVKGSPELILSLSDLTDKERADWRQQVTRLAETGHKVIACAGRILDAEIDEEPMAGLRFAGLLAFEDPVRLEVKEAVQWCKKNGIHVLMITGDHPITARAVAIETGLGDDPAVISMEDDANNQMKRDWKKFDVVARAFPSQKYDIVKELKESGDIVAVTGDGVNDVPALQAADIGIAMGERGTRAAREVASIVLMDDNFATIVNAVAEGRQLFANLRKSFEYLLTIHIPLVLSAAIIPFFGYPLLFLPIHIVWLEAIIHPTALLAFQETSKTKRFVAKAGRNDRFQFFERDQWIVLLVSGFAVTIVIISAFVYGDRVTGDVLHARTLPLSVLTLASAFISLRLGALRSRSSIWIAVATGLTTGIVVQVGPISRVFQVRSLTWIEWGWTLVASGAAVYLPGIFLRLLKRNVGRKGFLPTLWPNAS